jgi:acyl-CoA dehydrogenase
VGAGGEGLISFSPTPEHAEVARRIRAFIDGEVVPQEPALLTAEGVSWDVVQGLRAQARAAGIFAPQLGTDLGGLGLDWRGVAVAFEEAGTSLLGPLALNCAAPDEANMHLLAQVARPDQRERYLVPLATGTVRSCFAMTEPAPGAGADPTMLRSRARRDGGDWVIDGHKWYITGADGAAFAIAMVRTSDDPDPRRGATMFLVDAGTPGFEIVRHIPSLDRTFPGGHCEVRFTNCRVPDSAILGEADLGFHYAQSRLVPARLTHCARWLGLARRALEIAAEHAAERTGGGKTLGEHQFVQGMLADSAIDIDAARLLIWRACWELDQGRPARGESSAAKVFVAEAVHRVVDRAIQVCGALGISEDLPLGLFYREVRPFRIYDGPSEVHRASVAQRLLRAAKARLKARA